MGGSGGKMGISSFDGNKYAVVERVSIQNRPIEILDSLYWDIFDIYRSILENIKYFAAKYGEIESIGFDTWGASYGFLDKFGRLAEPVYHYRDLRTATAMEILDHNIGLKRVFELTGCQPNRTYTLPQLYATKKNDEVILNFAEHMIFLPDLFSYFLSGVISTERTIAGTSSLLAPDQKDWSWELLEECKFPRKLFSKIVDSGTIKGEITSDLGAKLKTGKSKIVAVPGHDTASAICAIPLYEENQLYLSVGTNVNMGIEINTPVVSPQAYAGGFKNTGGLENKIILYRDYPGFWIISLIIAHFEKQGINCDFDSIEELAKNARSINAYVDLEHPILSQSDIDIKLEIENLLKESNQAIPKNDGELVRCIFESIALKAKSYAAYLQKQLNVPLNRIVVVNGGSQNYFLMQLICDAIGITLEAGMPFATLDGNILSQLYALGKIKSLKDLRELSSQSFELKKYFPTADKNWNEALDTAIKLGICVG